MVDFLDSWVHIIPVWILDNILDQLVFPKLQKEVENWNPLTDTVPIHSWIHPWLPLMQARLEPLYSPIRSKLASALQKWHPSDSSAKLILQPWKDVFTPGSWEAFMVKNIVPKLGMCLGELVINPHQQHMDAFYWVIDWEGMISVSSLVGLLKSTSSPSGFRCCAPGSVTAQITRRSPSGTWVGNPCSQTKCWRTHLLRTSLTRHWIS